MKQNTVFITTIFLVFLLPGVLFIGCDQEPLFYDVAHAYPPIEPRIKGGPSKIVQYPPGTGKLYVTNGTVWEYTSSWNPVYPEPPVRIRDIAAITTGLFALGDDGKIYMTDSPGSKNWTLFGGSNVESIFGAGSILFACSLTGTPGTNNGYTIAANGTALTPSTGKLMGVAEISGSDPVLGTLGTGMYTYTGGGLSGPDYTYGINIIGVTSDGTDIYVVSSSGIQSSKGLSISSNFSGAVALWKNKTSPELILAGMQRSSGSVGYGYREIIITSGGIQVPGTSGISSVEFGTQYISAIGRHVVNHLWVVEGSNSGDDQYNPIIFASTAKNGLWSYRRRGNEAAQWNGED